MYSMTGYGKGEFKCEGIELVVEIKTVNNRYLDTVIKAPKIFTAYEDIIRNLIRKKLSRGHADLFVYLNDKREKLKNINVDVSTAKAYVEVAKTLKEAFPELTDDFTLLALIKSPDVVKAEDKTGADDELIEALKTALNLALENLNDMRKIEGEKLKQDMLSRVDNIESTLLVIKERAPLIVEEYRNKIFTRVEEYLKDTKIDESRILNEVAVFADRVNVDEEITRLNSHIQQFRDICKEDLVGRKLDFLVQEFNRESNTICSKSNDITLTQSALSLKNEIEKIREQVQNVE